MGNRSPAPRFDGFTASSETSARVKRRVRSRDTQPEMMLRRELWARGLRYRVNVAGIVGKPDIVFPRRRIVVFCDGDFFHGNRWDTLRSKLARRANPAYWIGKIEYNRQRDEEVNRALDRAGWRVLRFWESEIKSDVARVADVIQSVLLEISR